jgi:hypothetical protein
MLLLDPHNKLRWETEYDRDCETELQCLEDVRADEIESED